MVILSLERLSFYYIHVGQRQVVQPGNKFWKRPYNRKETMVSTLVLLIKTQLYVNYRLPKT